MVETRKTRDVTSTKSRDASFGVRIRQALISLGYFKRVGNRLADLKCCYCKEKYPWHLCSDGGLGERMAVHVNKICPKRPKAGDSLSLAHSALKLFNITKRQDAAKYLEVIRLKTAVEKILARIPVPEDDLDELNFEAEANGRDEEISQLFPGRTREPGMRHEERVRQILIKFRFFKVVGGDYNTLQCGHCQAVFRRGLGPNFAHILTSHIYRDCLKCPTRNGIGDAPLDLCEYYERSIKFWRLGPQLRRGAVQWDARVERLVIGLLDRSPPDENSTGTSEMGEEEEEIEHHRSHRSSPRDWRFEGSLGSRVRSALVALEYFQPISGDHEKLRCMHCDDVIRPNRGHNFPQVLAAHVARNCPERPNSGWDEVLAVADTYIKTLKTPMSQWILKAKNDLDGLLRDLPRARSEVVAPSSKKVSKLFHPEPPPIAKLSHKKLAVMPFISHKSSKSPLEKSGKSKPFSGTRSSDQATPTRPPSNDNVTIWKFADENPVAESSVEKFVAESLSDMVAVEEHSEDREHVDHTETRSSQSVFNGDEGLTKADELEVMAGEGCVAQTAGDVNVEERRNEIDVVSLKEVALEAKAEGDQGIIESKVDEKEADEDLYEKRSFSEIVSLRHDRALKDACRTRNAEHDECSTIEVLRHKAEKGKWKATEGKLGDQDTDKIQVKKDGRVLSSGHVSATGEFVVKLNAPISPRIRQSLLESGCFEFVDGKSNRFSCCFCKTVAGVRENAYVAEGMARHMIQCTRRLELESARKAHFKLAQTYVSMLRFGKRGPKSKTEYRVYHAKVEKLLSKLPRADVAELDSTTAEGSPLVTKPVHNVGTSAQETMSAAPAESPEVMDRLLSGIDHPTGQSVQKALVDARLFVLKDTSQFRCAFCSHFHRIEGRKTPLAMANHIKEFHSKMRLTGDVKRFEKPLDLANAYRQLVEGGVSTVTDMSTLASLEAKVESILEELSPGRNILGKREASSEVFGAQKRTRSEEGVSEPGMFYGDDNRKRPSRRSSTSVTA